MEGDRTALVIGYPAQRARVILEAVARSEPRLSVIALVHPERFEEAERRVAELERSVAARVTLIEGDPAGMDFGLGGAEYLELAERVDVVHAAYSILDSGANADECRRVNIGAAREVIELGRANSRAPRVVLYSSVFVSGTRAGRVYESELEAGQSFRGEAERTLAIAERMLRRSGLPLVVLRSGHLMGDPRRGEVEQLSGPYPLVVLLVSMPADRPLTLPPSADGPLPLTGIDQLAAVGAFVGREGVLGRTLHVLSDERVTLRRFLELCAEHAGRRLDSGFHPGALTRLLLGNPVLRLLPQNARGILEVLTTTAEYDTTNLRELAASGGPVGDALGAYLGPLVDHVRARIQNETLVLERSSAPWLVA